MDSLKWHCLNALLKERGDLLSQPGISDPLQYLIHHWVNKPFNVEEYLTDDMLKALSKFLPASPITLYRGTAFKRLDTQRVLQNMGITELKEGATGVLREPHSTAWSLDVNTARSFGGGITYKTVAQPSDILLPLAYMEEDTGNTAEQEIVLKPGQYNIEIIQLTYEQGDIVPLDLVKPIMFNTRQLAQKLGLKLSIDSQSQRDIRFRLMDAKDLFDMTITFMLGGGYNVVIFVGSKMIKQEFIYDSELLDYLNNSYTKDFERMYDFAIGETYQ